ncbi:MAG: caspase family protein [Rectinemataceae bacterium]
MSLVIGNGTYANTRSLANPANDAEDVAAAMKKLGWEVLSYKNVSLKAMKTAVRDFATRLSGKKAGFFYYAGHGIQVDGVNYLVPVDADIKLKAEAQDAALPADFVLSAMDEAGVPIKMVVLDACRDNPFEASRGSGTRGLAVLGKAPKGTVIVYATAPGDVSSDGTGRNGVFTEAFLSNLAIPGLEFREIFDRTGEQVRTRTKDAQNPWMNSSYYGKLYLVSPADAERSIAANLDASKKVLAALEQAQAESAKALAAAKTQEERDRITLQGKQAAAQLAAQREEAKALEREQQLLASRAAEDDRNRAAIADRARDAEQQLASLRQQAETSRQSMGYGSSGGDELAIAYYRIKNYERAIAEVVKRFDESLARRLTEIAAARDRRIEGIEGYAKEPWESAKEFEVRKAAARALAASDYNREAASLRSSYAESSQKEGAGLKDELAKSEASLAGKTWPLSPKALSLGRGDFDADRKSWDFTIASTEGQLPTFITTLTYPIVSKNQEELRTAFTSLDNAWKAQAFEARATCGLRRNSRGQWEAYVVEVSIVNLGSQAATFATKKVAAFPYVPTSPLARLIVTGLPALGTLRVGSASLSAVQADKGVLDFGSLPAMQDLPVSWELPAGATLGIQAPSLSLGVGETRELSYPLGTLHIPLLLDDATLHFGRGLGSEVVLGADDRAKGSFALLPGSYAVSVKGTVVFEGSVTIRAGTVTELPGYSEAANKQLHDAQAAKRKALSQIGQRKKLSLASLGAGVAGLALSGLSYALGSSALQAYNSANSSDALLMARGDAQLYSSLFIASAGAGGLALGAGGLLWPWSPSESSLQQSITDLTRSISKLAEGQLK